MHHTSFCSVSFPLNFQPSATLSQPTLKRLGLTVSRGSAPQATLVTILENTRIINVYISILGHLIWHFP